MTRAAHSFDTPAAAGGPGHRGGHGAETTRGGKAVQANSAGKRNRRSAAGEDGEGFEVEGVGEHVEGFDGDGGVGGGGEDELEVAG